MRVSRLTRMPTPPDRQAGRQAVARDLLAATLANRLITSPSVCAAVFDRSGVLATATLGNTTPGGPAPTPDTVYRIASMSKSFCAAAVLRLVDQGLVHLDAPITTYVPQAHPAHDAAGEVWPVTVRQLLTNASGLPEDNAWADSQIGIERDDLLALIDKGLRFAHLPGSTYQYSNLGFSLLGLLVENVTGERFTRHVERTLLAPLGLTHTHYSPADYPPDADIAPGWSTFDRGATWFERPFVGDGALASIGGLFSTLGDIARWSAWVSAPFDPTRNTVSSHDAVLPPSRRRQMQTAATTVHSDSRLDDPALISAGYGMGLVIELDRELGAFAQHSGGLPGFSSHMRWHLDSGIGVVAFANTDGATLVGWLRELLVTMLRTIGAPARRVPVWPATLDAARDLDSMLRTGADFTDCARWYTANVSSDVPLDLRGERARDLFGKLGGVVADPPPLEERTLWAESGSILTWRIPCLGVPGQDDLPHDAVVRVELNPLADTHVQRIELDQLGGTEVTAPGVVGGFQPLLPGSGLSGPGWSSAGMSSAGSAK